MMRDGAGRRHKEARMSLAEHGKHLAALEPAAILKLGKVGVDVLVQCLAEAADHQ